MNDETLGVLKSGKRGLHIGCGIHTLEGWLNADFYPQKPEVMFLNATKRFEFADNSFDYIFSEHMIEHVDYASGLFMLGECHRVLKPGGIVRITTPNLRTIIDIYQNPGVGIHPAYMRWAHKHFLGAIPSNSPGFFFNNFVRAWGHQFIYDPDTLGIAFVKVGFVEVIDRLLNESEHEELQNLEAIDRMPPGFLQLESLTLEGRKPSTHSITS